MARFIPFLGAFLGSSLFWLLDSALYMFYQDVPSFMPCLWTDLPTGRLVLRLLVVLALFLWAGLKYHQHVMAYRRWRFFSDTEDPVRGSGESADKSKRLVFYALQMANALNMSPEDQQNLRLLCYCYDFGKVGVSDSLACKRYLNEEERRIIDQHVLLGAQIAAEFAALAPTAELIYCHHERWDGSGIHGLKGENIPLACRIFSVCWAYDSLTFASGRHSSMTSGAALDVIRSYAGTALDPELAALFIRLMTKQSLIPDGLGEISYVD